MQRRETGIEKMIELIEAICWCMSAQICVYRELLRPFEIYSGMSQSCSIKSMRTLFVIYLILIAI